MMKVLIFAVSAGGGHMRASEALKQYILINDNSSSVKIIDTIKFINPILDKVLIGGYLKTLKKSPFLFGKLYNHTESYTSLSAVSNRFNKIIAERTLPKIYDFNPDIIVSTHPFPNEMLSILKSKYKLNIPVISILTDYAPHNFWLHSGIDTYIVSNDDMVDEMISRGIDKDSVFSFGIPVDPSFMQKYNKKSVFKQLAFNTQSPTILIMGGSLGIGNIPNIYCDICKSDKDIQIIVLTGNNKKLYSTLTQLSKSYNKKTLVLGYTKEVSKYMQCCDLLITKPGGITITEAIISNIPMALFCPIPGQEEKNANFLLRHGLAINCEDFASYKDAITYVFSNPSIIQNMKLNCSKYSKPNSGNDIYHFIRKIISAEKAQ